MKKCTSILAVALTFVLSGMTAGAVHASSGYASNLELGTVLFRLGNDARAVTYLEQAVAERPEASEALIPLGISLSRLGRHEEAVATLSRATLDGPLGADGAFFLAESHKSLGNIEKARDAYRKAGALGGPLGTRALIESARLGMSANDFPGAERDFEQLLQLQAAGELAAEARAGLAEIQRRKATRLAFNADLGLRYDTNVVLAPPDAKDTGGFRAVINLQGRYRPVETEALRAEIAVLVNQGRYLTPAHRVLDLGVHKIRGDLLYRLGSLPMRIGGGLEADYWTLDNAFYKRSFGVGPRLMIAEGANLATALSWHWRYDDYAADLREGPNRRTQLNQFLFWGKSNYLGLGGGYEQNRPSDPFWVYDLISLRLFGGGDVGAGVLVDAGIEYVLTPYLASEVDRSDQAFTGSLGLSRWWGDWGVRFSGAYVRNQNIRSADLSIGGEDYSKVLTGIDLRWRH